MAINLSTDEKCAEKLFEVVPMIMQLIRFEVRSIVASELSVPQFRVLHRLSKTAANNGELAEWIGVSLPAMSKTVDILVRRGLIQRQRGRTDRRQVKLSLTPKGNQLHDESRAGAKKMFVQKLRKLTHAKQEAIVEAFKILQEAFINSEEVHENNNDVHSGRERADSLRTPTDLGV